MLAAAFALCGCAARTGTNMGYADPQAKAEPPTPHAEPVCMLRAPLPSNIKHKVVGRVESSKQWYGSTDGIITNMAAEARRVGADAVVGMQAGQSIGFFAWARPVGYGMGVKLENRADLDCLKLGGEYR